MSVTAEKLEGNKAKLTIEVPAEIFEKSLQKAFVQVVKKINMPGFRKGKAPRRLVEQMYGREILLEDAVNDAIPPAFRQALDEVGGEYECAVYPAYEVVSSEKGQALVFTATYDLKPEVTLGAYKDMVLVKPAEVSVEEAVDKQLAAMRERFARVEKTEEPAAMGDICTIDFVGKVDGVPFEGGNGADYPLELGTNTFIPGFEEQLAGCKAGDELAVHVVFPEGYKSEELSGQPAVFDVVVKEVKHKFLSEMNDEFAQDVSDFETLAGLRQDLTDKQIEESRKAARGDLENQAVEKAMAEAVLELPASMVEMRQDQLLDNFARMIGRQGISFDQYMEISRQSIEEVRAGFRERAERELRIEFVLEAVAEAEGLSIAEAELAAEYERLAGETEKTAEEIAALYGENKAMLDSLTFSLRINKAVQFLADHAQVREAGPEEPADGETAAGDVETADAVTGAAESDDTVAGTAAGEAGDAAAGDAEAGESSATAEKE